MTMRDKIENWIFAAVIIVALPAIIFLSQRLAM